MPKIANKKFVLLTKEEVVGLITDYLVATRVVNGSDVITSISISDNNEECAVVEVRIK